MSLTQLADGQLPAAPSGADVLEQMVDVPGGKVFVRKVSTDADGVPLIALHGGPGFPSYYLEPLAALATERPVILFDQLGCGRSERPDDAGLWTIERFTDELDAVLVALGHPKYHLYGHSWGTMLATRYVTRHGNGRVASIVMSSPGLQVDWWEADCAELIASLPAEHRQALDEAQRSGKLEGADYEAAQGAFYLHHVSKRGMETQLFQQTVQEAGMEVYLRIQGPNEFTIVGDMKGWDFTPELAGLGVPVLYLTGAEDEARPNTVARYATMTPRCRMVVIPDAAHLTMLDNAEASNAEVSSFLKSVDAGRF